MSVINWLLIHGAQAGLWLWDVVSGFFVWLWILLDTILNPVLSPLLAVLNPVSNLCGDAVFFVLRPLPITWRLVVISVVGGVAMLFAFRRLSNQPAIGRAKDDIKANLLALKLFKDDLGVMFLCQARILWAILRLQRYVLTPVLWMTVPMLLVLAQLGIRYQWRPLAPGEQSLIRLDLRGQDSLAPQVTLEPSSGIVAEVGPVPGGGEVVWRVRAAAPGRHTLRFHVDGNVVEKELVVGEWLDRVSVVRPGARWTDQLLHPVEPRLGEQTGVTRIEVEYPSRKSLIHGSDYWVLTFFIISMIAALVLAPWFRVRF